MDKPRCAHTVRDRDSLSVACIAMMVLLQMFMGGATAQSSDLDQSRTMYPVVSYLMEVGTQQYKRGNYAEAEKHLLTAQGYQDCLSASEQKALKKLLEMTHEAVKGRKMAETNFALAKKLQDAGEDKKAKSLLKDLKKNEYLTAQEKHEVVARLDREPVKTVAETPAANVLASAASVDDVNAVATAAAELEGLDSEEAGKGGFIEEIKRRQAVIRKHMAAVMSDTKATVEAKGKAGEFAEASDAIEKAKFLVEVNKLHLGKELTLQYEAEIVQMTAQLESIKGDVKWDREQKKRAEAAEEQARLLEQQEIETQKTIKELLSRAKLYYAQMRYKAALAQLESLLEKDPLHYEALLLKVEIEDMMRLRRQAELERETEILQAETMIEAKESMIPHSGVINYHKDWAEIVAKPTRQPDEPISLDPASARVYQQLDTVVDLSSLRPEMSASEAFELLRMSVDPPLNIVVVWKDLLDMAEVEPTTTIDMDGLPEVRLGTALESLLLALAGGFYEIGYTVEEGVIKVATVGSLPQKMEVRIYDISDIIEEPINFMMPYQSRMMGLNMSRMMSMQTATQAMQYIQTPGSSSGTGSGGNIGGNIGGGIGGIGGIGGGMGGMGMSGMGGMGMGGMGMSSMGMGSMGMGGMGMGGMGMSSMGMGGMGMGGMGMGGMGMGNNTNGGRGGSRGGSMEAQELIQLLEESVEPDSWYDTSEFGDGTIQPYPLLRPKRLAIRQTRKVHTQIENLFDELRRIAKREVSIEARFLGVTSNFMEEIGLDLDMNANAGGKWGRVNFEQNHALSAEATTTDVPGSIASAARAGVLTGSYGTILDDLMVNFVLTAVQGREDSRSLAEPRTTVLSGEGAIFNLAEVSLFPLPPVTSYGTTQGVLGATGGTVNTTSEFTPVYQPVINGNILMVTPTIAKDKKNVFLSVNLVRQRLVGITSADIEAPVGATGEVQSYTVNTPQQEAVELSTRVLVPDQGTLLVGGQKITAERTKEYGIPILSKIPILGKAFSNTSTVEDEIILLLLVKPTIIMPDEKEAEALGAINAANAHPF